MHYWTVRFDYAVPLKVPVGKTYRHTGKLGVVAPDLPSAVRAVIDMPEYPEAVVWGVSHQGTVDVVKD